MASKKKKKQRNRQRQSFAPASSAPVQAEPASPTSPAAAAAPAPGAARATPAYSSGITGPRRATQGAAAATGIIDIDARVPYFSADLRRVLVTASVMIVLIVAGSLLIK